MRYGLVVLFSVGICTEIYSVTTVDGFRFWANLVCLPLDFALLWRQFVLIRRNDRGTP